MHTEPANTAQRRGMFDRPQIEMINSLHQKGRELAVLKRIYESYALIIERILERQKSAGPGSTSQSNDDEILSATQLPRNGTINPRARNPSPSVDGNTPSETSTYGTPLSSAASVRFERLLDRIKHLALSEIQECLDEKESLVFLNFNLLTYKESLAVEKLTRITILLAKVTILFMPVSLMTAYFSTQLHDLENLYSVKTYWICFAVIATLSFLFLLIFGYASGTLEGKPVYAPFYHVFIDIGKTGKQKFKRLRGEKEPRTYA